MCQMRGPVPPTPYGESTPSPINSALALYPNLRSDDQQTSPSQSDPNLHLAGLLVPGAVDAFGKVWSSKVPKEFMAPELPPILPLPGPRLAPLPPRPIGPAPALPAPIGSPLFKLVNPDANQASPPPFPAPPPIGPTLSPPSKPPSPLEPERILPDDIAKPGGQIIGGGFSIPKDPHAPLPGFPIPAEDDPLKTFVLEMQIAEGRLRPDGRRQLIAKDFEDLKKEDPNFGLADEIYREAGKRTTKAGGSALGTEWHQIAEEVVKEFQKRGEAKGVRAEVTYLDTKEPNQKNVKGSARVDLVWTREDGTIVIVDLKTGGANLSAAQIEKIVRNVGGDNRDRRVELYQYKP
ncbi:MAG: hypothetical protein Q8N31_03030 [Reyranella sp.]|nr:hypothetical protein [Reyranella sp.]MDP3158962.1 hypothetical protein [Reyranella sp.]